MGDVVEYHESETVYYRIYGLRTRGDPSVPFDWHLW